MVEGGKGISRTAVTALEDGVRDKGVGEGPATPQAEMMPPEKKKCVLSLSKKSLEFWSSAARGQKVASEKSGL